MGRREAKRKSQSRVVAGWLIFILFIILAILLVIRMVNERIVMPDSSMYPTLQEKDVLLVDKVSYHFTDPKRFDVVVFPSKYQENTNYIKRIIALPGETIQITDGKIYINGSELTEAEDYGTIENPGLAYQAITLRTNEFFVMSDNHSDSTDSREPSISNVETDQIIGKVLFTVWPLKDFGPV